MIRDSNGERCISGVIDEWVSGCLSGLVTTVDDEEEEEEKAET